MKQILVYLLFPALIIFHFSLSASESNPGEEQKIDILFNQKIPMRDGIELSATILKPANQTRKLPVIFVSTPYISESDIDSGEKYVKAGYVYISVDRRGRANSGGVFRPLEDSGKDGVDVIDWLIKQPWCNGQVVTRGGSYRGMVQWKIMAQGHKNLITSVPTASVYPGHDFPKFKNVFMSYMVRWLALTNGVTGNNSLFGIENYWQSKYEDMYKNNLPFNQLDLLTTTNSDTFQKWIQHPTDDKYWQSLNPTAEQYSKIDMPILTITGYFDSDQPGALRYYKEHMENASIKAKKNHYLLVGPWDHPGTRRPKKEIGGLTFGDNSVLDMDQLQIDWFNWVLKGKDKPKILKDRVNFYVMGENKWHHVNDISQMATATKKLYLSSPDSDASDVFQSGLLTEIKPPKQAPDTYSYNPLDNNGLNNVDESFENDYYLYQSAALEPNILIYHSAPINNKMTISGVINFVAAISMNVVDTDIAVQLYAIMPDGMSFYLGDDMVRARHRNGATKSDLVTPGKVEQYVFDGFYLTSRELPKGTRLRLIVSSVDSKNWQRNYNSGKDVSEQSKIDVKTAIIKLHLEEGKSYIQLPILNS